MLTVFISYARESDDHYAWVRRLADALEEQPEFQVVFDQYDLRAGLNLDHFMDKGLACERIVIVITPEYVRKAQERRGGVGYESSVISVNVREDQLSGRVVPLLRSGTEKPPYLRAKLHVDFRDDAQFARALAELKSALLGLSAVQRPPKKLQGPAPGQDATSLVETAKEIQAVAHSERRDALPWFEIASTRLPYIPLLGSFADGETEFYRGDVEVEVTAEFPPPAPPFRHSVQIATDWLGAPETKCRIVRWRSTISPKPWPHQLTFTFARTTYVDYLQLNERLDAALISGKTLRQEILRTLESSQEFGSIPATNICGVGLFVHTADDKIIIAKHSSNVRVYPNAWSFSASGTMDWRDDATPPAPHPFTEVARECKEEINHMVNLDNLQMIAFGIDWQKFYFQFIFVERTSLLAAEVLSRAPGARDSIEVDSISAIDFTLHTIVSLVTTKEWEPSAAAALLLMACKRFGLENVEEALDPEFVAGRWRRTMADVWDHRAARPGVFAVMSERHPRREIPGVSGQYIDAVMNFVGNDVKSRDVVEVGCGVGRLTVELARKAAHVTAIDLSQKMIERARDTVRAASLETVVTLRREFLQDHKGQHEVAVCSQVLMHNVTDAEFDRAIKALGSIAPCLFIFEHVAGSRDTSAATVVREENEITRRLPNFRVTKRQIHQLFDDTLVFLKLVREA